MDGEAVTMMAPESAAGEVFSMLTQQINFETILAVLGVSLGAGLALFLGWWAIRKISGMVFRSFNGKRPM